MDFIDWMVIAVALITLLFIWQIAKDTAQMIKERREAERDEPTETSGSVPPVKFDNDKTKDV